MRYMGFCTGYGKQTFGENGPFRSHFSVSNRPVCPSFTEFKAFMGRIQQKGARIRCKNEWTTTQCKNLNFTQIDPHHCFQTESRNCVARLIYHFVRAGHIYVQKASLAVTGFVIISGFQNACRMWLIKTSTIVTQSMPDTEFFLC